MGRMKAIVVTAFRGPEGLELQQVPEPVPAALQVLVDVEAVGVNFADVVGARGRYPGGPQPPYIAGREFAGTVAASGERVMGYCQFVPVRRRLPCRAPPCGHNSRAGPRPSRRPSR